MTTFKPLSADDKVSTKTLLHEAIPITASIISGTYNNGPGGTTEYNIKDYAHGMFQSVYDYPYLSSSANHIFDVSFGLHSGSAVYTSATNQKAKKNNIYNQMAQVLMGYDKEGKIQRFDEDGNLAAGGTKLDEIIALPFSRLVVKDEIKKGSFQMTLGVAATHENPFSDRAVVKDTGAAQSYKVNSPAGEYGILYLTNDAAASPADTRVKKLDPSATEIPCGLVYYQAGIAILTASVFTTLLSSSCQMQEDHASLEGMLTGSAISSSANTFRRRIKNIQFNNTIELNSTVYFCRVKHNEFNYSSNPTYLSGSQIRVKNETTDIPISYITSIGLYSADNQLLAVGKFSEPVRKDSNIELTFRARLDY